MNKFEKFVLGSLCILAFYDAWSLGKMYGEGRLFEPRGLCSGGVLAYDNGSWVCFREHANIKQWRPRWSKSVVMVEDVD